MKRIIILFILTLFGLQLAHASFLTNLNVYWSGNNTATDASGNGNTLTLFSSLQPLE